MPNTPKDNKKSRYSLLSECDYRRELPKVEGCDDILVAFRDSGMAMSGGMGAVPLTWGEINAMIDGGAYRLGSWGKRQIKEMSNNYCSMLHMGTENIPSPISRDPTEEEKRALGLAQLRAMERMEKQNNELLKGR